ncbi:hypothetical protein Q4F19_04265 [Sphingomonas sp. BIUV-7]|uniref:Antifreeze glycopeptide polyprotein n=1 Tax=Sphingomonas natans TaxID=3063330 RepID=A0ABT8Y5J0_9SPHN|nr:hypothetical protein [Sphingomonas sp. BIUV-7]MDO6413590.1 hypothetical protein [Sphingomonas sp. BIUV-7]
MKPPSKAGLTLVAALLAGGALIAPAIGQQSPESLLPPGFNSSPPAPATQPGAAAPAPGAPATATPTPLLPDAASAPGLELSLDGPENVTEAEPLPPPEELPPAARRAFDRVGLDSGYGAQAFGEVDGRYLATLMRLVQTPIASRWAEIMLRRMLIAPTPAPAGEGQADWVADRAALLLRLGEADAARSLVQSVDVENFSPRLRRVAVQTALATSDPAGLCPLPDGAETIGGQPIWPMVRAMCASLSGDIATANASIGRAPPGDPIDHALAERIVTAGGGGRRSVTVDWTAVDALTDWRFGLATALNVVIPQALLEAAPAWFQGWLARAPMLAAADRIAPARAAAVLGSVSSSELVDLYSRVMDEAGDVDTESPAGRLRAAYRGDDDAARLGAMHALWDKGVGDAEPSERERYASLLVTARAAAGIAPSADREEDYVRLLGSMFSAGLDLQANRWAELIGGASGDAADRSWAMIAVGAPRPGLTIDAKRVRAIAKAAGDDGRHHAAMLVAALAALGRLPSADAAKIAQDLGTPLGGQSGYGRALDRAVTANQPGTVAMLVATGLQTPTWSGVAPADFFRMIGALRAVGLEGEARMIAAEAMTRLS